MGDKSEIGWTDATWNPVTGCTRVSAGCDHCYASSLHNKRYRANVQAAIDQWNAGYGIRGAVGTIAEGARGAGLKLPFPDTYDTPFAVVKLHPERLEAPLHWRKPRRIFVNSMSDLFHEEVPDEFLDRVFAVMALTPQHTYQVLTKRPERMREYLKDHAAGGRHIWVAAQAIALPGGRAKPATCWPLPNLIGMTSVENQRAADERIRIVLETPLAKRGVSLEPMLGRVDLTRIKTSALTEKDALLGWNSVWSRTPDRADPQTKNDWVEAHSDPAHRLDWVIVGGESGKGRRDCGVEAIVDVVRQCEAAQVPVFVKQDSAFRPGQQGRIPDEVWARKEFPR